MKHVAFAFILSLMVSSSVFAQQSSTDVELGSDVAPPHGQSAITHNSDGSATFSFPTVYEAGAQRSIYISKENHVQVGTAYCAKMGRTFVMVQPRKPNEGEKWAEIDQTGNTYNFGHFRTAGRHDHVIEWIICR